MHKKLEAELVSLAHSILQMKNKDDINALHEKAHVIYEKLSVLKFVEDYVNTTPQAKQSKEEIIEQIEEFLVQDPESEVKVEDELELEEELIEETHEPEEEQIEATETPVFELEEEPEEEPEIVEEEVPELIEDEVQEEEVVEEILSIEEEAPVQEEIAEEKVTMKQKHDLFDGQISLEDELQRAYESDEASTLFEKVTKENPVVEAFETEPESEPEAETETDVEVKVETEPEPEAEPEQKRSLNDALFQNHIQVGLNDRIAFVTHLFDNSQEDFNRVLSQLNSFKTEKEAKNFINKLVRPDYDWTDKEEYEQRLLELVERKFM